MKKIVAILVAVGLLAGAVFFIGRSGAGTAELSLTFVGFETNGAAKFVVSNHSSRTIGYLGPSKERESGLILGIPLILPLPPGASREELLWQNGEKTPWRAIISYRRRSRLSDEVQLWLWKRQVRFVQPPKLKIVVTSGLVPPR